jgi:hypothetical protein
MYDMYVKSGRVREGREKFHCKLQGVTDPKRNTIHIMINKLSV